MRTDEVNIVALLDSPEEPPATSYAIVFLRSPICLSVARVPHVIRRPQAGARPGLRRDWAA